AQRLLFCRRRRARGRAVYGRRNLLRLAFRRARGPRDHENHPWRRSTIYRARVCARAPRDVSGPALDQSRRARGGLVAENCFRAFANRENQSGGSAIADRKNRQAALDICAALTVFDINIAMVIGPTPPGTGVIALHFGATSSNATSPTSR